MTITRDLERSIPFEVTRADDADDGDGLTMEGYAAVFGKQTRIDSWEGTFDESIRKGAFRKTLRERTPVLQFDHGRHPLIGSIPLGVINESREDDQGLFVSARMTDNWLIEPIRDAIREGSVDGMSFRFSVVREEWRDSAGKLIKDEAELMQLLWKPGDRGPLQRTLIELRVPELGPVVFPAYEQTTVGVRAREIADTITADQELRHMVRAVLALDRAERPVTTAASAEQPDLSDPELRHEVARALLFDPDPDAPPDGHPSTTEPRQDAGLSHVQPEPADDGHPDEDNERSDDAPTTGHPSDDTDAPPPGGHPSMSHRHITAQLARLNGRIDAAERHFDMTQRRSPSDEE